MPEDGSDEKRIDLAVECRQFRSDLPAYLEGEEKLGIRPHANQCASCGALITDLERITLAAKELPLESPPDRVWSNIRATLAAEGGFRSRESIWKRWTARGRLDWSTAVAGGVASLALVLVFLFSTRNLQRKAQPGNTTPYAATATASTDLAAVQGNLVRTIQQMEDSYKAREDRLDPSAKLTYQKGLSSLDASIHECLISLHEQPHNSLARDYLMQAYEAKAEVLASALEYDGH